MNRVRAPKAISEFLCGSWLILLHGYLRLPINETPSRPTFHTITVYVTLTACEVFFLRAKEAISPRSETPAKPSVAQPYIMPVWS